MRGISWRVYGIGFLAACAMLLFLHVWDRNLTAQTGGGEGSYGGGATAFCVNGIVVCANGGSPVCRYGSPPISCVNNTPICSGAGEGSFPPYVVCSAPPSSQTGGGGSTGSAGSSQGGGGGSQSGGSSSADPQAGFCCMTDGQPCAPMTFEQCNVSGIGFAQDQATCNRLCGAAMSSSAQSSSATTTTTTCSPPIANQNFAVYGVTQVCRITAPAGKDIVIAQPQKYNGVYGPGQDYIPYNWRVASIISPGWNCQELLSRGVNCSPNGQAAGTIVVTFDAYGQCGFTANVASKALPAGTPYSALTHSWHNDGTWADFRVPFPACPAGGSNSDGSGGSDDSSGSGRSQSSSSSVCSACAQYCGLLSFPSSLPGVVTYPPKTYLGWDVSGLIPRPFIGSGRPYCYCPPLSAECYVSGAGVEMRCMPGASPWCSSNTPICIPNSPYTPEAVCGSSGIQRFTPAECRQYIALSSSSRMSCNECVRMLCDASSSSPPSSPSSGSPSSGSPSSGSPSSGSPSSGSPSSGSPSSGSPSSGSPSSGSPSSGSPSSGSPSSGSPSSGSPSSGSPSSGSPSSGSPSSGSRSSIITTSLACCNPITGQCSARATCSIWEIEYASSGACAAVCRPSSASSSPATHTYCNAEKACKSMSGPGADQCNNDADCLKDKHLECFMDACRLTTGAGRDLCAKDEDCKVSHAVCLGNKCAREAGAGANQCTTDADCAKTTHLGCLRMACRILGGAGSDLCAKDSDCISTYSICQFRQCTERPGIGLAQCTTDADCMASSSARSSSSAPLLPQCGDGRDNDGDGKIDFPSDPGCYGPSDESEVDGPRLPQCSDNVDNDGDGLMDFPDDPGCTDLDDTTEADRGDAVTACGDGRDNDSDGKIDFPDDPGCSSPLDNSERNAPAQKHSVCGNGFLERPSEECDDGNARSFDGCTEHCFLEIGACGDGVLQKALGEQCEPPLSDPALPYLCENCRMVFPVLEEAFPPLVSFPSVPFSPSSPSGISPYAFLPPSIQIDQQGVPLVPFPFSAGNTQLQSPPLPRRTTETGPELLAVMAAGAAGGWAFLRRRGWRKP